MRCWGGVPCASNILLSFDGDRAGREATSRAAKMLAEWPWGSLYVCGKHHVREVEGKFTCACGRSLEVLWNAPYMVIEAPKKAPNK